MQDMHFKNVVKKSDTTYLFIQYAVKDKDQKPLQRVQNSKDVVEYEADRRHCQDTEQPRDPQ